MVLMLVWLAVMLSGGAWWIRRDVAAYARFRTTTDTFERQRFYRRWLIESFAVLLAATAISLWLAGTMPPFDTFPAAFEPAHRLLHSRDGRAGDQWLPMAVGISTGTGVSIASQWRRIKKARSPKPGLDAPLIPLNRREALLSLLLSLNAGFSEELFFRLALPLLLIQITGSLASALAFSLLCFGLAHAHYGWKGVLGTMGTGGLLTLYYLHHGSLIRVMAVHIVIDVIAFFIRPGLASWIITRKPPQWAATGL